MGRGDFLKAQQESPTQQSELPQVPEEMGSKLHCVCATSRPSPLLQVGHHRLNIVVCAAWNGGFEG